MQKYVIVLSSLFFVLGCDSKRVEAPVKSIDGATVSLEQNKAFSTNLDSRVNDLIGGLTGLNSKVKTAMRVSQGFANGSVSEYTPLDAVLDILTEAKKGVASKSGSSFQKEGLVELSFLNQDSPCRVIHTLFSGESDPTNKISAARLVIRNSCVNNGQDIQIASAQWVNEALTLNLNLYDLQTLITDQTVAIINKDLKAQTGCQLSRDANGELNSAQCSSLVVRVNDAVVASFDHLSFSGSGDASFAGDGRIEENGVQKATFDFTIPRDSDIKFNVKKTEGK